MIERKSFNRKGDYWMVIKKSFIKIKDKKCHNDHIIISSFHHFTISCVGCWQRRLKRGSYLQGWCPPASLSSIKRGMDTERARLGTIRGFGTEHARPGTLRGFGTARARGTFRGFGTERARLGTLNKNFEIFTQNEHYLLRGFLLKVLDENPKIVLPTVILKKKFQTPNFTKFSNP